MCSAASGSRASLGYAVEQFFDNGGREALIVRVVNGARSATLTLKAGAWALQLQALRPGTREFLRASVDFDNIPADELARFQSHRAASACPGHRTSRRSGDIPSAFAVAGPMNATYRGAIAQSALIRLVGEMPTQRPDRTLDPASGLATAYVNSNSDGDDGAPLTDYDLIGSSLDHTGLFALHQAEYFNFLCIPPLSRDRDVGPSALLVAARYCKERRALLIVDPPSSWQTADDALRGMRDWDFPNENALMYFPRSAGARQAARAFRILCALRRGCRHAGALRRGRSGLGSLRIVRNPFCGQGLGQPAWLARIGVSGWRALGVNTLQAVRSAARMSVRLRTLAAGNTANADWRYLSRAAAGAVHLEQHRTGYALGRRGRSHRRGCRNR